MLFGWECSCSPRVSNFNGPQRGIYTNIKFERVPVSIFVGIKMAVEVFKT